MDVAALLIDARSWFRRERPALIAITAQARSENRRVLASELAQVISRLEHALRVPGRAAV
jgi:hypothetical protein